MYVKNFVKSLGQSQCSLNVNIDYGDYLTGILIGYATKVEDLLFP